MRSVGIDVGGTGIKAVLLDDDGHIIDQIEDPTTPDDPDTLVATVVSQARRLGVGPDIPLGVAVAAFVDTERRVVQFSPNISWVNRPLAHELETALSRQVLLDNDANAACYGEFLMGAGRDATSLAMFTLGTGVGGAVMDSGRLLVGANGLAGELGHIPIDPTGPRCGCGLFGCLEAIASGSAIVSRAKQIMGHPEMSPHDVGEALQSDVDLQNAALAPVAKALAHAIVTLRSVTNPDTVIIGGGVMERLGSVLLDLIKRDVSELLSTASFPAMPRLVAAQLGNRAGGIGVALLAKEQAVSSL